MSAEREHVCTITQGRKGERGDWCIDCGRKVHEVETRQCQDCTHYIYIRGGICQRHNMCVTPDMLVTFKIEEGTCFAARPR